MPGRNVSVTLDANVSGYLAKIQQAAAATSKFADTTLQAAGKNEKSLNQVSTGVGLMGAAVAAGIGKAVVAYSSFDQAMSSVAATGSDAKANLDALRQAAIDAGASTAFSATQAAEGIENLAKAGVSAQDTLGGGLQGALDLAAAGQISVAEASEVAATALTQFGLAGRDVPHVADLLAAGAGKAQGEVSDMAAALKQSGLVAAQFGLSIEDTTGTLAAFASAGLLGSDAGTSLKTMLIALANPSKESAAAMQRLGIAAYDAQGQFVGVTNLAEQLRQRLGELTPAQRDATLATIFGSDAIRAANILYTQGAEGIQGWIDKVNDQGYAAETARTKLDNLRGDLEALGGAAETAFIGLGEGADGPLRSLIQGGTDAINMFNDLGSGTKQATLVVLASVATLALSGAGIAKLAVAANEARNAFRALGISAKAATIATAGIGTVIGVAALAVGHFATKSAESRARVDDLTQALQASNGALDANVRAMRAKALEDSGALQAAQTLGLSIQEVTAASLGDAAARERVTAALRRYQDTGVGVNAMQTGFAASTNRAGLATKEQAEAAQLLSDQLKSGNRELDEATAAQARLAEANEASGAAAGASVSALTQAEVALQAMSQSSGAAADELRAVVDSMFAAADAALALSNAQIGFEDAIDAAAAAAKKNKRNLDLNTAAGRENQTALNGLAAASHRYIESLVEQGAGAGKVAAATQRARDAFIRQAVAMGRSKEEAAKLATALGLVPKDTKAKVSTPGAKASEGQVKDLETAIKDLPKDVQAKIRSAFNRGGVDAALAALRAVDGKTATTYITTVRREEIRVGNRTATANGGEQRAEGGKITGPGTGTSDDVPVWASNGEWFIKTAAAQFYGDAIMAAINDKRIPKSAFSGYGYASGGKVGVGYASGGRVGLGDVTAMWKMIGKLYDPLAGVRSAQDDLADAQRLRRKRQRQLEEERDDYRDAKSKKARKKAAEEVREAEDRLKDANGNLRDATRGLRDAQMQAADQARELSDALSGQFATASLDARDWLDRMKQGQAELARFNGQIHALRELGLNETNLQQIIDVARSQGVAAASELATSVQSGGRSAVSALNNAANALNRVADATGWTGTTKPQRKALGGPVVGPGTGTSDSVPIMASNGEWIVPERAASDPYNRAVLEDMTYAGRRVTHYNHARGYAMGGPVGGGRIDVDALRAAFSGMRVQGVLTLADGRAYIEGIALEVVNTETRKVRTRF